MPRALQLLCGLWLCAAALPAAAHKPSDSYLTLQVAGRQVDGQWDIALRDLEYAIGLDADGDGELRWGEVRQRHAAIAAYALARLALTAGGAACTLVPGGQQIDRHTDGAYTVLRFRAECAQDVATLSVAYRLFADLDPQHRGLLRLDAAGLTRSAVFAPQSAVQDFDLRAAEPWRQFTAYGAEGVWHIWIGFDHVLFLLALLLPSVLVWQAAPGRAKPTAARAGWQPAPGFRRAFIEVLKIVTSFTLAHSITLSLAALGLVSLPSRGVESAIAASVLLAALNNVRPLLRGRLWLGAFGFGLLHGFGFASVLADLGLPQGALVLALVGFNLGVELGQLAVVAVFLPLAFALRRTRLYRRGVMVGGSLAVAALSAVWLAERLFGLKLLGA